MPGKHSTTYVTWVAATDAAGRGERSNVVLIGLCSGGYEAVQGALAVNARGVCVLGLIPGSGQPTWVKGAAKPLPDPVKSGLETRRQAANYMRTFLYRGAQSALLWKIARRVPQPLYRIADRLGVLPSPARPMMRLSEAHVDTLFLVGTRDARPYRVFASGVLRRLERRGFVRFRNIPALDHGMLRAGPARAGTGGARPAREGKIRPPLCQDRLVTDDATWGPANYSNFDFFAPPIRSWLLPSAAEVEPELVEPELVEPEPFGPEPFGPEPVGPEPFGPEPLAAAVPAEVEADDVEDADEEDLPLLPKVRPRRDPIPRPKLALLLTAGFVGFLVVLNLAVVAFHVVRARNQLDSARQTLQAARASISAGDLDKALTQVSGMHAKTQAAASSTSGAVWHFDEHLPLIGGSLTSAGSLARSVNDIAANALPGLTRSVTNLKGGRLRNADGTLNLALIQDTAGSLTTTTAVLTRARAQVAALPAHPLIGAVGSARTQLLGQIDGLLTDLNGASEAARLAPAMLGADGPRKYFLALENPAESRGAGGLIGAYGIVVADKGRLSLETVGVDDDFPPFQTPVINVSPEFTNRWRVFNADVDIRDATASPHFPWDAQDITQLWYRFKDEKVDGVIALDPAAAASLIQPGQPLVLSDGTTLTNKTFATYVEQTLYAKFANDEQTGRKLELEDIERGLFKNLQSGSNPEGTLKALGHAAGARELLLESNHPDEQAILAGTPLGGAMPRHPRPIRRGRHPQRDCQQDGRLPRAHPALDRRRVSDQQRSP